MSVVRLSNAYLCQDVYKGLVDPNHFLVQLRERFDWHAFAEPLMDLGNNDRGGRPRHSAVLMLKMLFVAFLFNHSDRETEFAATNNILVKFFLGLPIDGLAPDHTCLCRFRDAVLERHGTAFFDGLFRSLVQQAKERGIGPGIVAALDATHTFANVSPEKPQDPKTPRDPGASWGCKGNEKRTTADGQKVLIPKYFYGYKAHLLVETGRGLVTGLHVTPGHVADIDGGDWLLHRLLTDEERAKVGVLTADKGYGCPVWINMLEKHTGILTAFFLPKTMVGRGKHKRKWEAYLADEGRKAFRAERYVVEQVNGDLKQNHGMGRCRYLGLAKYKLQAAMASMAHNLKIYIRELSGARFKPV